MTVNYENLARTNKKFEEDFKKSFEDFLQKGWYVLGQQVKQFEKEFADYIGTKYCIGVASGLDALIISLECPFSSKANIYFSLMSIQYETMYLYDLTLVPPTLSTQYLEGILPFEHFVTFIFSLF